MRKNTYGVTTTNMCTLCGALKATTKNKDGVTVCKTCKDKEVDMKCPVCKNTLDAKSGRFGDYFFCWCCNKNWNKQQIMRWLR